MEKDAPDTHESQYRRAEKSNCEQLRRHAQPAKQCEIRSNNKNQTEERDRSQNPGDALQPKSAEAEQLYDSGVKYSVQYITIRLDTTKQMLLIHDRDVSGLLRNTSVNTELTAGKTTRRKATAYIRRIF